MEQTDKAERKQKTSKSRKETAVQGTNDNSIVSKFSMSAAGYFQDAFLQNFVAKNSKRAPLINRGYYLRAVSIDQIIRHFLKKNQHCQKQIISLGAGFDSAYFRLKSDGVLQDTAFYEIDFPEVMKRKHALIQSSSELSGLLKVDAEGKQVLPPIELSTKDYCMLGVDLTQLNTLEAALRLCGADFDTPTLLLSECVMTYMTRRCSSALVKWAGETFQDGIFVMFEQVHPDDAFGIFMQNHFNTIGSPLKCINSFPTVESQIKRFLDLGWQKCKCHDLNEMYRNSLSSKERARIETLDPFDEYEEFSLKCAHYFVLVASTSTSIADFCFSGGADCSAVKLPPVPSLVTHLWVPQNKFGIKRFSHSSVLVKGRYILTSGGFGEVDSRHQRVQEISVTDTITMETRLIRCQSDHLQYARMHHTSVVLSDGRVLLCGGRQSPFFLCSQLLVLHLDVQAHSDAEHVSKHFPDFDRQEHRQEDSGAGIFGRDCGKNCDEELIADSNGGEELKTSRNVEDREKNEGRDRSVYKEVNSANGERDRKNVSPSNASICDSKHASFSCSPANLSSSSCELGRNSGFTSGSGSQFSIHDMVLPLDGEERTDFEWGCLKCSVLRQSGDIPCPRWRHATTLVRLQDRECVFLHGGRTQKAEVLSDCYVLDVGTGVWTKMECGGECPGALHSHAMQTWGNKVVVVGGMDEDQNPQASLFLLDMAALVWTRLTITGLFLPRYSHSCHIVGDKLIVVGGVNLLRQTPGVGVINLSTGEAQEFSFPSVCKSQLLMYHRHCSVILPDHRVIILGGGGNCFSFGTHLNNTPVVMDIVRCLEAVS